MRESHYNFCMLSPRTPGYSRFALRLVGRFAMRVLICLCVSLAACCVGAQTWNETSNGGGDAGQLPGTAQAVTGGSGPLNTIVGTLATMDDSDVYLVKIANPAAFSATTSSTIYPPDTQVFLFSEAGLGIAYCDDEFSGSWYGTLNVGNPLYNTLTPGNYLVAVSSYPNYPQSSAGAIFPPSYPGVFGAQTNSPLTGWAQTSQVSSGAYTLTLTGCEYLGPPPDMVVEFNSVAVASGGTAQVGSPTTNGENYVFTIRNNGAGDLQLSGTPLVSATLGVNCDAATGIQAQPTSAVIPASGTADFTVFVDPTNPVAFDLTISIASNNPASNPYTFTIEGTAVLPNGAAVADPAPGSPFSGGTNGPFNATLEPGETLNNVSILLTDVDSDNITVTSIVPTGTAPAGILPPPQPSPAHPLTLSWTGVADAANTPGAYSWTVEFTDAGTGIPVAILVTITIADRPPIHALANAIQGVGSAGDPYLVEYTQGDAPGLSVDVAWVSDPNTNQSVSLANVIPASALPAGAAGFTFSVQSGVLSVEPAGTLVAADAGLRAYTVQVTDGTTTPTNLIVSMRVLSATGAITFATPAVLPDAVINEPYSQTLQIQGGAGGASYLLLMGSLPGGLSLNSNTGIISGTPLVQGLAQFTIRVRDSAHDTATQSFELSVKAPVPPPTAATGGSGGSGCAAQLTANTAAWALLGALAIIAAYRRRRYGRECRVWRL